MRSSQPIHVVFFLSTVRSYIAWLPSARCTTQDLLQHVNVSVLGSPLWRRRFTHSHHAARLVSRARVLFPPPSGRAPAAVRSGSPLGRLPPSLLPPCLDGAYGGSVWIWRSELRAPSPSSSPTPGPRTKDGGTAYPAACAVCEQGRICARRGASNAGRWSSHGRRARHLAVAESESSNLPFFPCSSGSGSPPSAMSDITTAAAPQPKPHHLPKA